MDETICHTLPNGLDLGILNISRYSAVSHQPRPPEIFAMGKLFMKGLRYQIAPGSQVISKIGQ